MAGAVEWAPVVTLAAAGFWVPGLEVGTGLGVVAAEATTNGVGLPLLGYVGTLISADATAGAGVLVVESVVGVKAGVAVGAILDEGVNEA